MKGMKNDLIKIDNTLVLTSDFPRYNLSRGQVGTVIEILDNGSLFLLKFSFAMLRSLEIFMMQSEHLENM